MGTVNIVADTQCDIYDLCGVSVEAIVVLERCSVKNTKCECEGWKWRLFECFILSSNKYIQVYIYSYSKLNSVHS